MNPTPLVSVVIPTSRRPHLVPAAVRSALDGMGDDVEVIVVPNGPDRSWVEALATFSGDGRVQVEPIGVPHANAARNHGLELARGKYIRFLDDDDVLLPGAAARQCDLIESTGVEIHSCGIRRVEDDGTLHSIMALRDQTDLVVAMARPGRICLPHAHLFRRALLAGMRWNDTIPYEQDTDWMLRICTHREWDWAGSDEVVGIWHHHLGTRTSKTITSHTRGRVVSGMFIDTARQLMMQGRLEERRADAFAEGLWAYIHAHYFKAPIFWTSVAREALSLSPGRRPDDPIFRTALGGRLDPVLIELALSPGRIAAALSRAWAKR